MTTLRRRRFLALAGASGATLISPPRWVFAQSSTVVRFDTDLALSLPTSAIATFDRLVLGYPAESLAFVRATAIADPATRARHFDQQLRQLHRLSRSDLERQFQQLDRLVDLAVSSDGQTIALEHLLRTTALPGLARGALSDLARGFPSELRGAIESGDPRQVARDLQARLSAIVPAPLERVEGTWKLANTSAETTLDLLDVAAATVAELGNEGLQRASQLVRRSVDVVRHVKTAIEALRRASDESAGGLDIASLDLSGLGDAVAALAEELGASERAATAIRHVGNTLQGALSGGMAGAAGGPPGIIIGAVVGGLTSLLGSVLGGSSKDPTLQALEGLSERLTRLETSFREGLRTLGSAVQALGEGMRTLSTQLSAIRRDLDRLQRTFETRLGQINQAIAGQVTSQVLQAIAGLQRACQLDAREYVSQRLGNRVASHEVLQKSAILEALVGEPRAGLANASLLGTERLVDLANGFSSRFAGILQSAATTQNSSASGHLYTPMFLATLNGIRQRQYLRSWQSRSPPIPGWTGSYIPGMTVEVVDLARALTKGELVGPTSTTSSTPQRGRLVIDVLAVLHELSRGLSSEAELQSAPPGFVRFDRDRREARRVIDRVALGTPASLLIVASGLRRSVGSLFSIDTVSDLLGAWRDKLRAQEAAYGILLDPRLTPALLAVRRRLATRAANRLAHLLHNPAVVAAEVARRKLSDQSSRNRPVHPRAQTRRPSQAIVPSHSAARAELHRATSALLPLAQYRIGTTVGRGAWAAARRAAARFIDAIFNRMPPPQSLVEALGEGLMLGLRETSESIERVASETFRDVFVLHLLDLVLEARLHRNGRRNGPRLADGFFEWAAYLAVTLEAVRATQRGRPTRGGPSPALEASMRFLAGFWDPRSRNSAMAFLERRAPSTEAVPFPVSLGYVWGWGIDETGVQTSQATLRRARNGAASLMVGNPDFEVFRREVITIERYEERLVAADRILSARVRSAREAAQIYRASL